MTQSPQTFPPSKGPSPAVAGAFRLWFFILTAILCQLPSAQAGTHVQLRTVFGDIHVDLLEAEKPRTTENFKRYVRAGSYNDIFFHRLMPNFVIQAGGFQVGNRGTPERIIQPVPTFAPIENEFVNDSPLSNIKGTLAMAKVENDPDSATSQWFINLADNAANLDFQNGGFTVFARVVGGYEILEIFNRFGPQSETNILVNAGVPLNSLPQLKFPQTEDELFENLLFVDVSLLNIRVEPEGSGGKRITWDTVRDAQNIVEYTTVMPPQWQTLVELENPDEETSSVVDTTGEVSRFYRVRVVQTP